MDSPLDGLPLKKRAMIVLSTIENQILMTRQAIREAVPIPDGSQKELEWLRDRGLVAYCGNGDGQLYFATKDWQKHRARFWASLDQQTRSAHSRIFRTEKMVEVALGVAMYQKDIETLVSVKTSARLELLVAKDMNEAIVLAAGREAA